MSAALLESIRAGNLVTIRLIDGDGCYHGTLTGTASRDYAPGSQLTITDIPGRLFGASVTPDNIVAVQP